jgi:hypothetical protein
MLVGYGFLASAARPGRAAHSSATNAKILNVIVLIIFRFIDFPLRYGFQYTLETYDDGTPLNWFPDFHSLLAGVKLLSHFFSLRHSYITGAAVPSDHLPTGITNSVMGSGPP